MPRKLSPTGAVALALILIVALGLLLFQWNWLRWPLAAYVGNKLDRNVAINGDLHVELSPQLLVQADDIVVANADWGSPEPMARVERLALRVDLRELLSRRVVLPEVSLVRPRVLLERDFRGAGNWEFPLPPKGSGPPAVVGALNLVDAGIRYRDTSAETDLALTLNTVEGQTIRFAGQGSLRKEAFTLDGHGAPLLMLRDTTKPYRLVVQANVGDTRARFDGSFVPLELQDIDGRLELQGKDLSKLFPTIPVPLPWTPPYRIAGRLVHDEALWALRDFSGRVGDSDLSGEFAVDNAGERPRIVAALTSRRLNYKDLGGFIGIPPGSEPKRKNSPEQKREAQERAASPKVLPDKPYEFERLRAADARVRFAGAQVVAADLPLERLSFDLELEQGELRLKPLKFDVAGGSVVSDIVLDARSERIETKAQVSARNLELGVIMPRLKPPKGKSGRFGGRARLSASGNSVARMLASLDGEAAVIMAGGQASTLTLLLTNLDLANAATLLLRGDENSTIRCVVTSFAARRGLMETNTLIADTTAVNIRGTGSVDLGEERYDLVLKAKSKELSPLALRGPIVVKGSFKHPEVKPAVGPVAARAGAAVALGVLATPIAAILPLIDTGGGQDSDCAALIVEAESDVGATPR